MYAYWLSFVAKATGLLLSHAPALKLIVMVLGVLDCTRDCAPAVWMKGQQTRRIINLFMPGILENDRAGVLLKVEKKEVEINAVFAIGLEEGRLLNENYPAKALYAGRKAFEF